MQSGISHPSSIADPFSIICAEAQQYRTYFLYSTCNNRLSPETVKDPLRFLAEERIEAFERIQGLVFSPQRKCGAREIRLN